MLLIILRLNPLSAVSPTFSLSLSFSQSFNNLFFRSHFVLSEDAAAIGGGGLFEGRTTWIFEMNLYL
jgi:hypothetical protein